MAFRPSPLVARLDRVLYPDYGDRWDDELFRQAILGTIRPDFDVLDLGAGAGIVPQMNFRHRASRIAGVDPDPRVLENPHLDEAKVARGEEIPYPTGTFDLAFSDNVLEHLEQPATVFREVRRVLKRGGRFLFKTVNRRHYIALFARSTPLWFHRAVNRRRGRADVDTFPTRYLANTPERVRALALETGYEVERIDLVEGRPEYLRISAPTYLVGWGIERAINGIPALHPLRAAMIGILRSNHDEGAS